MPALAAFLGGLFRVLFQYLGRLFLALDYFILHASFWSRRA